MTTKELTRGAKVWFLAAGQKKVGPMTLERVRERIAEGKLPGTTRAWREGMDEWRALSEIPELGGEESPEEEAPAATVDTVAVEAPEPEPAPKPEAKPEPKVRRRPLASGKPATGGMKQEWRVEAKDVWRAFAMGFEAPRVKLALGILMATLVPSAVAMGAMLLAPILGILAALAATPVTIAISCVGLGALSYQTRRRIEGHETPSPGEALSFAKDHVVALIGTPVLLSLLALVPPILLGIKSLLSHIPTIGPALAGLSLGLDILLAASTLFLIVAEVLGWSFGPVVVAFEGTGVIATVKALLGVVKSSIARLIIWSLKPGLAYAALSVVVTGIALVVLVLAILPNYKLAGGIPIASVLGGIKDLESGPSFGSATPAPTKADLEMVKGMVKSEQAWTEARNLAVVFLGEPRRVEGKYNYWYAKDGKLGWELCLEDQGGVVGSVSLGSFDVSLSPRAKYLDAAAPAPRAPARATPPVAAGEGPSWVGIVGAAGWTALVFAIVAAILTSVGNALAGFLYLGCRPGNDDLITRDDYLARRAVKETA